LALAAKVQAGPRITNISPPGLRIGATTTITVQGSQLLPAPGLLLGREIKQTLKPGATANQVQFDVALPPDTAPGTCLLRLVTSHGISNGVLVEIDDLEQKPFTSQTTTLPVALYGNFAGSSTLTTSFAGRKGQRIVVDVAARRLGATFDPVMELFDARGVPIAWAQGRTALSGDARLQAVLPADGEYKVALHDVLYRGETSGPVRLKIGALANADLVFPLGGQRGTMPNFELLGNGLEPGHFLTLDLRSRYGEIECPLPTLHGLTGPAPQIVVEDLPEVLQAPPFSGSLQEVRLPAAINGRLLKPGTEDRYRLIAEPGSRWRFDVLAGRAGSALDAILAIRNEKGAGLAEGDDRPETVDPGFDFTVPAGMHSVVLGIRDLQGRGGPEFVYRISIVPLDRQDFRLQVFKLEEAVPRGGKTVIRVHADRAGYQGPIRLRMQGLVDGLQLQPAEIPPQATETIVTLSASEKAGPKPGFAQLFGESADERPRVRRVAEMRAEETGIFSGRFRNQIALAVVEPSTIGVSWESTEDTLSQGASVPVKLKLTRNAGAGGAFRISLLSSQVVPKTADGKQEDINRSLRLATNAMVPAGQTSAAPVLIVPADLPDIPYDLAIRAELLGPDGSSVTDVSFSQVRRFRVKVVKK
jgi:hypothetical protein